MIGMVLVFLICPENVTTSPILALVLEMAREERIVVNGWVPAGERTAARGRRPAKVNTADCLTEIMSTTVRRTPVINNNIDGNLLKDIL